MENLNYKFCLYSNLNKKVRGMIDQKMIMTCKKSLVFFQSQLFRYSNLMNEWCEAL